MHLSRAPTFLLVTVVLAMSAAPAAAQTWTGAVSGNWSNGSNWSPTGVPSNTPNTQLTFGATANAAMTNDLGGTFNLNQMTFGAGDPAYSLAGNALAFQSTASAALPSIVDNSANAVTIGDALTLTNNLTVSGPGNITLNSAVGGPGSLTMSGSGILTLGNAGNSFTGGITIPSGTVQVSADGALGTGPVTLTSALATLTYAGTTTTSRALALGQGTLGVNAGATLTVNGGSIVNCYLIGPGTIATDPTNGAVFAFSTSQPSVAITSNSANDRFVNFVNGGKLTVPAGVNTAGASTVTNFNGFTNQGSGAITIAAGSRINVANFQSYGMLTLNPATNGSGQETLITNTGTTPLYFNSGSQTMLGTPATAPGPNGPYLDALDLHGQNLVITGGLFVNNGLLTDSVGGASVIVGYGALFKGAGNTLANVVGSFQVGAPGAATFGSLTLGPGGIQNYGWQIDDALGTAGPSGATGTLVRGWSLARSSIVTNPLTSQNTTGNLTWTATSAPGNQFDFALQTLVAPTPIGGPNVPGAMDNFNPLAVYVWPVFTYQGTYTGPTGSATLTADTLFDVSGFANSFLPEGRFTMAWQPGQIDLVYAPVPELGTLVLTVAGIGLGWVVRRGRNPGCHGAESRCTVPGENAGRHTEMYSAPAGVS
jgi:autotransporter-associated beta strand protein